MGYQGSRLAQSSALTVTPSDRKPLISEEKITAGNRRPVAAAERLPALSRQELAFVRAWAEGIEPARAWEHFLQRPGSGDARRARAELLRLLELLRRLARLNGRPELAALLRRDPQAIVERGGPAVTLEQFSAGFDEDFYSEAELLELYQQAHGAASSGGAARRRQRLRTRLVQAVQWLGERAGRDPQPQDAVTLWLDAPLAARLARAGLARLSDLHGAIARHGRRWHRGVPRLGPRGAAALEQWLQAHRGTLGALPSPAPSARRGVRRLALPPVPRPAPDGVPVALEHWAAPGFAQPDAQALRGCLAGLAGRPHTQRAYRREAERWLLWAALLRGRPLAALTPADTDAYRAFLAAPPEGWLAPRGTPRGHEDWRPFEGPLSPGSQATALRILRAMGHRLVAVGHLASNPWQDAPPAAPAAPSSGVDVLSRVAPRGVASGAGDGTCGGIEEGLAGAAGGPGGLGGLGGLGESGEAAGVAGVAGVAGATDAAEAAEAAIAAGVPGVAGVAGSGGPAGAGGAVGTVRAAVAPAPASAVSPGQPAGRGRRSAASGPGRVRAPRRLPAAAWAHWESWLQQQAPSPAHSRLRLAARWSADLGLRLSELTSAQLGWIGGGGGALQLADLDGTRPLVLQPPRARSPRPLSAAALAALRDHLADRGRTALSLSADTPVLSRLDREAPLSAARLHDLLEAAFRRCADSVAGHDPVAAAALRRASSESLRRVGLWACGLPEGAARVAPGSGVEPFNTRAVLRSRDQPTGTAGPTVPREHAVSASG
jgi:hypothetical protein